MTAQEIRVMDAIGRRLHENKNKAENSDVVIAEKVVALVDAFQASWDDETGTFLLCHVWRDNVRPYLITVNKESAFADALLTFGGMYPNDVYLLCQHRAEGQVFNKETK